MKCPRNVLLSLPFVTLFFKQALSDIDVPHLQFLASQLTLAECMRIVQFDINYASQEEMQRITDPEDCFHSLVRWICQIRAVTRNTYPIVKEALENIGRKDLIDPLKTTTRVSAKVIRQVEPRANAEDYEESATQSVMEEEAKDVKKSSTEVSSLSNKTSDKINGHAAVRITVRTAGIVFLVTVLVTCCCTLCVRNRIAHFCNRLWKRKKKISKFIPVNSESERSPSKRTKLRKKRKRAPSYETVNRSTQPAREVAQRESEEQPTTCYMCYKKKRRKSGKRH